MKIYCSGIGGIGLSAYAAFQRSVGHDVLGSDRTASQITDDLKLLGISVTLDQSGAFLPVDTNLFVYSEAVPQSAPERLRAEALGIRQQSYPEALGSLTEDHRTIAVCGTHGKSSTTAMAGRMLLETENDPSIIVGTKMRELSGRNWRKGQSDLFVIEACEYLRSFLKYKPSIVLLTTCDGDHFDYYKSQEDYESAFAEFLSLLPDDGIIIAHGSDPACRRLAEEANKNFVDADAHPLIALQTPGVHMQQNAQLVLALAKVLDIDAERSRSALAGYAGSWRRLEMKGTTPDGVIVIDDYAHHPAEIRATIAAITGAYPTRRVIGVFQPHTHDRTLKMYDEFTKSFTGLDTLIVPNIYDARSERGSGIVDVETFVRDIEKRSGVRAIDGRSLAETEALLRKDILRPGDVLLCMGAGDVTTLSDHMVQE